METVRLPDPHQLGPEDQKVFENTKQWFRIDFVRLPGKCADHLAGTLRIGGLADGMTVKRDDRIRCQHPLAWKLHAHRVGFKSGQM